MNNHYDILIPQKLYHAHQVARLAKLGMEAPDVGLPIKTLEPGQIVEGRFLPPLFAEPATEEWFLTLCTHHWPGDLRGMEYAGTHAFGLCRKHTHPSLIGGDKKSTDCPACEAGVELRTSAICYFIREDAKKGGMGLKFSPRNHDVLRLLIREGAFDFEKGRRVRISCWDLWRLGVEFLDTDPVDRTNFQWSVEIGDLFFNRRQINEERIKAMAAAKLGWEKMGCPESSGLEYLSVIKQFPHSTLIPIPFGCKGPV